MASATGTAQVPGPSSLTIVNTTPSARTLTLRKRPRVSYVEQLEYSSEEEDEEEEEEDDAGSIELERPPTEKKVKIKKEKPIPKRKIFPFLSLPNEIKNAIYEICLTDDNGVYLISQILHYRRTVKRAKTTDTGSFNRRRRINGYWWQNGRNFPGQSNLVAPAPAHMSPEILSISCKIRDEALPFLYSSNDFIFEDTQAMHAFLVQIGPKNCALLSDLTIKGWGFSRNLKALNHPAMSSLAAATNLQKLRIDCAMTWYWGSSSMKRAAAQIYRDGYHFLEAYGVAYGSYDAAVDILELSPAAIGSTSQQINEPDEQYEARKENGHKIFKEELREMLGREW